MSDVTRIAELIARIAKIEPPAPDADIYRAGLESTDALELLLELEDMFSVAIPDDRFITARTSDDIAAMIGGIGGA
ncbi:MAG: acyl carrier protein [Gemmatimonadales bacterium]|nr:acyl carrier protein [Gemmatimonadales bacterium]